MRRVVVTSHAQAYVACLRKRDSRDATWFDVAEAYDAGLKDGVMNRKRAKLDLVNLRRQHEVYDSSGFRKREVLTP